MKAEKMKKNEKDRDTKRPGGQSKRKCKQNEVTMTKIQTTVAVTILIDEGNKRKRKR